jgi:hypothetical protein
MKDEKSLGDDGTLAGATKRRPASEASLGDERTLGDNRSGQDTVIDDIEVVDLELRYKVEGTLGQGGMGAVTCPPFNGTTSRENLGAASGEACDGDADGTH